MKPFVTLLKLGRMPYAKAWCIQRALFERLKDSVVLGDKRSTVPLPADCNAEKRARDVIGMSTELTTDNNNANNNDIRTSNSECNSALNLHSLIVEDSPSKHYRNFLLLVEHNPVYTIGLRSRDYDDDYVFKLKEELARHQLEAEFVKTNRGGLITYHGPGQLVAYPIIYLGDFKERIPNKSLKSYVSLLELTIIKTLSRVGVEGAHTIKEHPGVWLNNGERKIAFIGVACKRYTTMHGISINCDCDLNWFEHIVSCGIKDKRITSIRAELFPMMRPNRAPATTLSSVSEAVKVSASFKCGVDHVSDAFCSSFSEEFDCSLGKATGRETEYIVGNLTHSSN